MIPKRPYLLRAFYDWLIDSQYTPHILVDATAKDVTVPRQHIKEGRIVLNISPGAIQDFMMDNDAVSFSARFGGVAFYVYCPVYSIMAIYAREVPEEGIHFPDEYTAQNMGKAEMEEDGEELDQRQPSQEKSTLQAVSTEKNTKEMATSDKSSPATADKPSKPALRVVK